MKILIAVSAPFNETPNMGGREWQWRRNALAAAVSLVASRVQLGQNEGSCPGGAGVTAHFKVEQSQPSADDKAA